MRPDPEEVGTFKSQIVPISRLNSIEIYGSIKISTPLLKLCNKLKIPCYFNTYHGVPIGQFIPEKPTPSVIRLKQYETFLNEDKKLHIAKAIVRKASQERVRILKKFIKEKKLQKKTSKITQYIKKINGIKSVSELRGIEGNIMKIFFETFSNLLSNLPFNGRSQRPPKDEGNAILSFGNVILYNSVRAQIYRSALDPLVGFLHEPYENRNSLALDIAEIFRPIIVDNLILQLDHKNILQQNHFNKDEVKVHLNKL
ncbi:MAG: CRISPR-associated endonuclease Cas1, partial [Promethearchaeota archaeon]